MRKQIIAGCILLLALSSKAQQWAYSVETVPDSLKKNAHLIMHLDHTELNVEAPDKAVMQVHQVYTVLNEEGKHALFFNEYSSRHVTLGDVDIKVFDKAGKQLQKFRKKDLTTVGVGEGLIDDGFVTYYRIAEAGYPMTVDISYEKRFKSSFFPAYYLTGPKEGVVLSDFILKLPSNMNLRYRSKHTSITPVVADDGKIKTYTWTAKNLVPFDDEEGSVYGGNKYPHVDIVTDRFSYFGFEGDLSSWNSFGNWLSSLYNGLDELSEDRKKFFRELVKDIPDDAGKVKKIYEYMQHNFRYVSIQLGIGGLRPFAASFTDDKKYGDCKALSNYMKAALKAVGIRSHIAIINARHNAEPVDPDFPANNFDHAILCVPAKDSIWLECTSATAEFGKLGTFTENRNALLVTENGGKLVATPASDAGSNRLGTKTTVVIENDLSAISRTIANTSGFYREFFAGLLKENHDDQKKALVYYFGFRQPDDFVLAEDSNGRGTVVEMAYRKVSEFNSGDKYFFSPRINKSWIGKLPSSANRKMDFYFRHPFEATDTTIYKLGEGMKMETLPQEKDLHTAYSSYHSKSWFNEKEGAIYTASSLVLKQHHIPSADYAAVTTFFEEVTKNENQRIVIRKTSTPATAPPPKTF